MTRVELFDAVKKLHSSLTIRKTQDGEYRLSVAPSYYYFMEGMSAKEATAKNEAVAYYSNDREDVLATAQHMATSLKGN